MAKTPIPFIKMAGAGNDFILIDAQKGLNYKSFGQKVCDRTNGVGADGLIVCDRSRKQDFRMRIFNADGSEAEMCGNGARCLAAYIVRGKKTKKKLFTLETLAGEILAKAAGEIADVRLSNPRDYRPNIPVTLNKRQIHLHYIDTGVPHAVVFVDQLKNINVSAIGPLIRFHKKFQPRGANVNFIEQIKKDLVQVRTYERGVENETKACGTGSVAAAIISFLESHKGSQDTNNARMKVLTVSSEILDVRFKLVQGLIQDVWLKGSAKFIAEGKFFR